MSRVSNFSAGPAALPLPALERAREELLDFAGTGMSVMEQSHRGKAYEALHEDAIARLRRVAGIPDDYVVLFLQGGASMQFAQIPLAFLLPGASADYVVSGVWGEKAVAEAQVVAKLVSARVRTAASTGPAFVRAPKPDELELDPSAAYVHVTSNETIHGNQMSAFPATDGVPLVCDMSSDFLGRRVDFSRFAFVYAGAQKNVGPSGVCIVVARKDLVAQSRKDVPRIWRYDVHADAGSLYNTPPTFGIYLVRNVLAWMEDEGGLDAIESRNRAKAAAVYAAIDARPELYACPVEPGSRSFMNVVFRLPTTALEDRFVAEAKARGMVGLKGHRSVGGIRASLYNAVTLDDAQKLAAFMAGFG